MRADPAAAAALLSAGVGLNYIGHRLGHNGRSERWLRARVDWLTENQGFPAPLPSPRANERRYSRRAVDQWFDARLPDDTPPVADMAPWHVLLEARAARLHEMGGAA